MPSDLLKLAPSKYHEYAAIEYAGLPVNHSILQQMNHCLRSLSVLNLAPVIHGGAEGSGFG
jgi:hypothetical protein